MLVFGLAILFGITTGWAEAQKTEPSALSKDALQAKIEAISSRQGIDEAFKTKVLKYYQSAQDNLASIETYKNQEAIFKQASKQIPDKLKRLQKEIEQVQPSLDKDNLEDFSRIPVEELAQRLILEKGKLTSLTEQLQKLENDLSQQSARPKLIRQEILAAQQDLEASNKKTEPPAGGFNSQLENEARQVFFKTLSEAKTAELKMLEVEAISNPARVELLKTQTQLLDLQKNALSLAINSIENILAERRQQEAKDIQDALNQAEKELAGKPPVIRQIAQKNIDYSKDLQTVTEHIDYYNQQKTTLDEVISQIDNDYKSADKKISLAGLSPALGRILHKQRRNLLAQDPFTIQAETVQTETATTSLEQFQVEDELKRLMDVDAELRSLMSLVDADLPADQRMMIQAEARILMNHQKELLNKLSIAYTSYLRILGDFDFASQQLIHLKEKFAAYLDEKLLWVKSSEPITYHFFSGLYHAMQWLLSPFNWLAMIQDFWLLVSRHPILALLGLACFALLLKLKKPIKVKIRSISEKIEKIYTDNIYYTLIELGYTLLLVLPIPLFMHFVGRFLTRYSFVDNFTMALGEGLQITAIPLFFLQFFYRLFSPTGIARKHFHWPEQSTYLLYRQIAWLRFVAVCGVFIIHMTGSANSAEPGDYLGRLALIIIMLAIGVFFSRLLDPQQGVFKDHYQLNPNRTLVRLRYFWYAASFFIPLIIIGFAIAGYYLSALELQQKLVVTLRLIFLLIVTHALVIRWLTLVNRLLAIKNARQKRKAAAAQSDKPAAIGAEDPILPIDEQQIDIPKLNEQTIKLLNVFIGFSLISGFWVIWKQILPAFSFFDDIVLWQHLVNVDNQDSYQPITLTNLLLAGFYIFIIVIAIRNFYGVMELLIFRRWAIEPGSRYAVNQLARYLLVTAGIISVANELGGSWSQVQWLVAALSVGLGFGLQEIFANLVSGIILLFERPIRIGDVVTIGTVTGKVSRIEMRATTLIDLDQKDLIVPNKTFITNQLVNWTLSDAITRLVIPVGIAYDSNIERAHQVMLDTVRDTPLVLAEPEPSVLFIGFGDSSLDFSIRIYVDELKNRLPVTHDLLMRLEKAFREHHIEIPVPQRDIHIRSLPPEAEKFAGSAIKS